MIQDDKQPSLYVQIKTYILSKMNEQHWSPHDRIPSEHELMQQFSVSRITVKKAMTDLVEMGVIYRIQGKGTFVSPPDKSLPSDGPPTPPPNKRPIALLLPFINNQFNALLLNGVERIVSAAGYPLLFCNTENSQAKEERVIRDLVGMGVAGMIIYPVEGESYNREILQLTLDSFPLVVMDRYLRGMDTNFVCSDNVRGAQEAVDHLLSLGHRNIGFVSTTVTGTSSIEDRLLGYEKSLADHQIPIDHRHRLVHLDIEVPKKEEIRAFLTRNPELTAIFAINPGFGLEILKVAEEMNIRVPQDMSLIFFDDFELSEFHYVRPTCISQEEQTLGQEAAKLLLSIMENPAQEKRKLFLPPKLIIRESTAPPGQTTATN